MIRLPDLKSVESTVRKFLSSYCIVTFSALRRFLQAISCWSRSASSSLQVCISQTFQMEQHVRLVILEHLCHKFHIHVLHVDLLLGR